MKDVLSVIALIISTFGGVLGILAFFKNYRKKLKITSIPPCFRSLDRFRYTIWQFKAANIGSKQIVISEAYYRLNNVRSVLFKIRRHDGEIFPVRLTHGDILTCYVEYGESDLIINKIIADKLQFILKDITGKEYRTKWLNIKSNLVNYSCKDDCDPMGLRLWPEDESTVS